MRRRPEALRLAALLCLALGAGACSPAEPDGALLGTIERDRIEIVASAAEPLAELLVREGDRVSRGQVLARLDERRAAARLEAAEAQVRRAEARLAELERGARSEQRAQVSARLKADRAELAQALLDRDRKDLLVGAGIAAREEADLAWTEVARSRAALQEDQAVLDEMVSGATVEELRQARADLDAAFADTRALRVDLERMSPRAPVSGRVDALPYAIGELPGAGATLVVLLSDERPHVRVRVPEPELGRLRVGIAASVEGDGLAEPLPGCLRFVAREAEFTPHFALSEHDRHRLSFAAEVLLTSDEAGALPSGLPVRVFLHPEREACGPEPGAP